MNITFGAPKKKQVTKAKPVEKVITEVIAPTGEKVKLAMGSLEDSLKKYPKDLNSEDTYEWDIVGNPNNLEEQNSITYTKDMTAKEIENEFDIDLTSGTTDDVVNIVVEAPEDFDFSKYDTSDPLNAIRLSLPQDLLDETELAQYTILKHGENNIILRDNEKNTNNYYSYNGSEWVNRFNIKDKL